MSAAIISSLLVGACGHARPVKIGYGRSDLGHCGPIASIDLEADERCAITLTELNRLPRTGVLDQADCAALFGAARHARLSPTPRCAVPEPFTAGVRVNLGDGTELRGCHDDPLAMRMASLAERYAPALRKVPSPEGLCDPVDCTRLPTQPTSAPAASRPSRNGFEGCFDDAIIEGDLATPDAGGCAIARTRECRRSGDGSCGWETRQTRTCPK